MTARQCLELKKLENGNLDMVLTPEGRVELLEMLEETHEDDPNVLDELIEYNTCNGWDRLQPEEIGALTSCDLILTDDCIRHETTGDLIEVGAIWWNPNYQIVNPVKKLLEEGHYVLTLGPSD